MKPHEIMSAERWMTMQGRQLLPLETDEEAGAYADRIWHLLLCSDLSELAEYVTEMEAARPERVAGRASLSSIAPGVPALLLTLSQLESVVVKSLVRRRVPRRRAQHA